ncbi:TolB family protein [Stieleria varia]|uniref:Translocation protein TolB n=1 Tax=Stieleria varia TaxID=2528005 RepID=A0A5C6B227_9BACT|nr:hypothetical protein [Stieleria varia]TWU05621.1 translocation protein TolB [Stieleria varia]
MEFARIPFVHRIPLFAGFTTHSSTQDFWRNPLRQCTWQLTLCLAVLFALHQTALAQTDSSPALYPGELTIQMPGALVSPASVPTLKEIAAMSGEEIPQPVAVIRVHSDANNHYAPTWSGDGTAIGFLRSDLQKGTRKAVLQQPGQAPVTIYDDRTSFEDMVTWSSGPRSLMVFESNNEPNGSNNVHQTSIASPPQRITSGNGVIEFPAIHSSGQSSTLVFRRDRELYLATYRPDSALAESVDSIGEGEEAQLSPNGRFMAIVRRNESGNEYRLVIRETAGEREKTLCVATDAIIRNPRISPRGNEIAFHRRDIQNNRWALWVIPTSASEGDSSARELLADIRVQEDFRHVGPTWSPHSSGLWCFANTNAQAHYPLQFVRVSDASSFTVEYPLPITSASEAACNPVVRRPVLLFAGHTSKPRDIFAIVLSHQP